MSVFGRTGVVWPAFPEESDLQWYSWLIASGCLWIHSRTTLQAAIRQWMSMVVILYDWTIPDGPRVPLWASFSQKLFHRIDKDFLAGSSHVRHFLANLSFLHSSHKCQNCMYHSLCLLLFPMTSPFKGIYQKNLHLQSLTFYLFLGGPELMHDICTSMNKWWVME